jgi:aryl-alcohol dehydrogenase-like predicted oxidoreductase
MLDVNLIHAGNVRYIGSSMSPSWRTVESLWVAKELGLNLFVSAQPAYQCWTAPPNAR